MPAGEFATTTSDDLVTGEGVALDLPPAGLGARMVSGLLDVVATAVALFGFVFIGAIASVGLDPALQATVFTVLSVAVIVGIPTALETLTRGRSLGKLAMGLRTVRDDAGPISAHHALVRALIGSVEVYLFAAVPAFFSMMLSTRGKRLGDYAAGTYVVRMRVPASIPPPVPMPPHLVGWARSADVAALPTGLVIGVRQYLGRAATLDPASRARVGAELADEVSAYVAPLPAAGTRPEDFLAAVLAERRERDLRRLRREAEFRRRLVGRR